MDFSAQGLPQPKPTGGGLSSLFMSEGNDPTSNDMFKYQQQTKKSVDSVETKVYAVAVFLYDPQGQRYVPAGKGGLTILTKNRPTLVMYKDKLKPMVATVLNSSFIFTIQNQTYGCFQNQAKTWSVAFGSNDQLKQFGTDVFVAKKGLDPEALAVQDLELGIGTSDATKAGDHVTIGLEYLDNEEHKVLENQVIRESSWTKHLEGIKVNGSRLIHASGIQDHQGFLSVKVTLLKIGETASEKPPSPEELEVKPSQVNRVRVFPVQPQKAEAAVEPRSRGSVTPRSRHSTAGSGSQQLAAQAPAPGAIEMLLTEQRLHHLSLLSLDQKLDRLLAAGGTASTESLMEERDDLKTKLEKAQSDFTSLEHMLNNAQEELTTLRSEMETVLSVSKQDQEIQTEEQDVQEEITRKVLKKVFKKLRKAFQNDTYSKEEILAKISDELTEIAAS